MTTAVAVALAAGLGALLRQVATVLVQRRAGRRLPWGTLTVNLSGSLLAGAVAGSGLSGAPRAVLLAGLAGGFTTLSTWALETRALVVDGRRRAAAGYALGTLLACVGAAAAGAQLS